MKSASLMRVPLWLAVAGLLGAMVVEGRAQVVVDQPATPASANMQGLSTVISAAGEYNLSTSAAAINMTKADQQAIQNRMEGSKAYYELRDMNDAYRAKQRGPKVSQKDMNEYLQKMCPKKLKPNQLNPDGRISWPSVLTMDVFADDRTEIDQLFVKRAENGGLGFEDQTTVRSLATEMLDQLKQIIRQIPGDAYVSGKNFLQSLVVEANSAG